MATTYDAIGTYTISGSSTATITFSGLPTNYTDLVIAGTHAQTSDNQGITAYYNGDNGNNYPGNSFYSYYSTNYFIQGDAVSTPGSSAIRNQAASGYPAYSNWGGLEMYITEYRSNKWKNCLYRNTTATDNGSYLGTYISFGGTTWKNTAAITSITIVATGNFTAGSVFTLYGITAG